MLAGAVLEIPVGTIPVKSEVSPAEGVAAGSSLSGRARMMVDDRLLDELIPILQISETCGFKHSRRSPKRWAKDGVRDTQRNIVRLGTVRVGGRLFSTRRHVAEFLTAIQSPGGGAAMLSPMGEESDDCLRTAGKVSAKTAVGAG